jgi:hypothetical protein
VAALEHKRMKRVLARAEHAAGVDQLEPRPLPFDRLAKDITGGARQRRHNGATRPAQAVEQGRLAHIGTADQHDGGNALGHER